MPGDAAKCHFGRSAPLGAAATEHAELHGEKKQGVAFPLWWLPPLLANHDQAHSGNQVTHLDVDNGGKPHRDLMSHRSAEPPTPADSHSHVKSESSNPERPLSFIAKGRETLNSWTSSALLCALVFLLNVYAVGKVCPLLSSSCEQPALSFARPHLLPAPIAPCTLLAATRASSSKAEPSITFGAPHHVRTRRTGRLRRQRKGLKC